MRISFRKLAVLTLSLVYLVIAAGAIVRMTGSGMGCPDWPKCFGYYIPPTNVEALMWQPNREFSKGQVIIVKEALFIANRDFKTNTKFKSSNWDNYSKHDYAKFNVWHTWIEYINRLLGALAGLATLALALFSFRYWNRNRLLPFLSWLVVLGMGFQAWLGATVVYSVLEPLKITLHMFMALAIVALLLFVIFQSSGTHLKSYKKGLLPLAICVLLLTLLQIFLGTQVRQFIDDQIKVLGYTNKNAWLQKPELQFYVHRSLSILVIILNGLLFWKIRKNNLKFSKIKWVLGLIGVEVATGIAMYYFHFPFSSQPLHLILASILFGVQFYLFLEILISRKSGKSL